MKPTEQAPLLEAPAAALASPAGYAPPPAPASERRAWLTAAATCAVGVLVLAAVLSGVVGRTSGASAPPPVLLGAGTPAATLSASGVAAGRTGPILARPTAAQQRADAHRFAAASETHIAQRWIEGFYPVYAAAQGTFGVNWLLIASIHMQETAFSTATSTYHGLNFAGCCGGPMQFNVTNGPVSTWSLVRDSYVYGRRPAVYDHMTAQHPSIYDDFDAIMAAAHLLSADGAGYTLDYSAWSAAYDYYGHDATGVLYADQVLARAIGWSRHGFCGNCGVDPALTRAVHAAYGAPVAAALAAPAPAPAKAKRKRG
ncbi:MAG TPA: hypothetical protein VGN13_08800 [Solirubrobacteraceae bacterium]|jgi:hypothetical protein